MADRTETRLMHAACLLAPALITLGFQQFVAPPRAAGAAVDGHAFVAVPQIPALDPDAAARQGGPAPDAVNPFNYERPEDRLIRAPQPEAGTAAPQAPALPDPVFTLTSVLPGSNPYAVINGKPYTIGQSVAPGWTLTAIRGDARSVVVTHKTGRSQRLRMR